jgi:hypothetical protein
VSAYCLTPIVDDLVARKTANTTRSPEEMQKLRSAALADVVATVDTAVKMSSDGEAVMLKVHEPTEMLIIRTGPKQREAAERVLKAMEPAGANVVRGPADIYQDARIHKGKNSQDTLPDISSLLPLYVDPNEANARVRLEQRRQQERQQELEAQIKDQQQEIEQYNKLLKGAATQPAAPANK